MAREVDRQGRATSQSGRTSGLGLDDPGPWSLPQVVSAHLPAGPPLLAVGSRGLPPHRNEKFCCVAAGQWGPELPFAGGEAALSRTCIWASQKGKQVDVQARAALRGNNEHGPALSPAAGPRGILLSPGIRHLGFPSLALEPCTIGLARLDAIFLLEG